MCGIYPAADAKTAGDEISSTYEGRHLTFLESELNHPNHADALVDKGDPVIMGENVVGVAFRSAVAATDYITIDTEGIWALSVTGTDELGNNAVVAGDELFLNKTTCLITKNPNKNTNAHFGYALGAVDAGATAVIAVKVHWDPDDAEEVVGATDAPFVNDTASNKFREYYYDAGGGGIIEGERMELAPTAPCVTACVDYRKLILDASQIIITGRSSVIEARLEQTAGAAMCRTMAVLCLDWSNLSTNPTTNYSNSYIMLRDRQEDNATSCIRALFHFFDHDALDDGGVTLGTSVIQDSSTDHASDVRVTCTYGDGNNKFWLMGTTTAPD